MEQKYLSELHEEHKVWLNKLKFYTDEIKIMQSRIEEIATKNNGEEVLKQVDHFQNQLIIQKEQIDILNHEINEHEKAIESNINNNPTASDHRKADDHLPHRDKVETFEKLFNELRQELIHFLAVWM